MNLETDEIWNAMKDTKYRRTMQNLTKLITETKGDFNAALKVALNEVANAVHAEAGTLWFYNRNGDGLIRPRAVYSDVNMDDVYLLPGQGIAGKVIQEAKPEIITNCQEDKRWAKKVDSKTGFITKSMICVPLIAKGITFGCIQIINKIDGIPFDESDLEFVLDLSNTASNCFVTQNLLDGYFDSNFVDEISFDDMFLTDRISDVEANLRSMEVFAKLTSKDQSRIIEYGNEIWKIFHSKNR